MRDSVITRKTTSIRTALLIFGGVLAALGFGVSEAMVDVLAKTAAAARPYLLGGQFTAADVAIGSTLRWGMMFKLLPERPEFAGYLARLSERPALKRATEKDTELQRVQEAA